MVSRCALSLPPPHGVACGQPWNSFCLQLWQQKMNPLRFVSADVRGNCRGRVSHFVVSLLHLALFGHALLLALGVFLQCVFLHVFFDMRMLFSASSMYTYMLLTVMFIVGSGPRRTRGFFWNENSAGKSRALTSCGQRTIQLVERWSPLPDVVVVINATYSLRTRQGLFGLGILVLV